MNRDEELEHASKLGTAPCRTCRGKCDTSYEVEDDGKIIWSRYCEVCNVEEPYLYQTPEQFAQFMGDKKDKENADKLFKIMSEKMENGHRKYVKMGMEAQEWVRLHSLAYMGATIAEDKEDSMEFVNEFSDRYHASRLMQYPPTPEDAVHIKIEGDILKHPEAVQAEIDKAIADLKRSTE